MVFFKSILTGVVCAFLYFCLSYGTVWIVQTLKDNPPGSPLMLAYGIKFALAFCASVGYSLDYYRRTTTQSIG